MLINKKYDDKRLFLSICDTNLGGKKYEEMGLVLEFKKSHYKTEISVDKLKPLLANFYFLNCAGKKATGLLIEEGIVEKSDLKHIKQIPYVFVLRN